jgi:alkanesulfonate monooxygenase SsuD/methylene tetrahydromethanopterin reductase-like flavin-dependent oxidoreductase (luciferase family)
MEIKLGVFAVPDATDPSTTVEQLLAADRSGLDVVGVQDHPYQRRFFDTWTLLAYVAGRTERIRLVPDVTNLPLRLPTMLAKAAASLDVLTGGRVEVGLGAGAFWDAVEAMGGPRRTPKESVDALEEARRERDGARRRSGDVARPARAHRVRAPLHDAVRRRPGRRPGRLRAAHRRGRRAARARAGRLNAPGGRLS